MQNGFYVSLSGQKTLTRRLETIADNVANMNTVGFRASGVSFAAEVVRTGETRTAFVSSGLDYVSRRAGALVRTDNQLDMAIQGDGWFGVRTADGVAYTRDGRMRMSESGVLETLNGAKVLDAGGAPIVLDPHAGQPVIAEDGMITQQGRQFGAIGLFAIDDRANLTRVGNSSVVSDKPAKPVLDFTQNRVVQGWVEQSNVNPIKEMTKLISITRTFDSLSAGMAQTDSAVQDAIKTLGGQP
jgi:flagellar basal-body rod protein FlgF